MTPLNYFNDVWERADALHSIYKYISSSTTSLIKQDEILRSEWVARVSALDLFVHELVIKGMIEIFEGGRPPTDAYKKYQVSIHTLDSIRNTNVSYDKTSAFELELRQRMSFLSFQEPEKIADAIRYISPQQLWNNIAKYHGASASSEQQVSKHLKTKLSLIIQRRNQIAHEGDLQHGIPRYPWAITKIDVDDMSNFINNIVSSINKIIVLSHSRSS